MWIVRQAVPGYVHHFIARFVDREFVVNDDGARARYLDLLGRAMSASDWQCLAYAIMSNHLHLAMFAGATPAERWTRRVHPPFAAWLNKRLERIGPVIAGSSALWVVPPETEARVIAYVHNNPVRAGLVAHARESTWTSHRAYLGLARVSWLATDVGLARLRVSPEELDVLVDDDVGYRPEPEKIADIRRAARKRGALEVGSAIIGAPTQVPLLARPFSHLRPHPQRVLEIVSDVTGVAVGEVRSRGVKGSAVLARSLAVHVGRSMGLSISNVSAALGISAQAGSRLGLRALDHEHAAAATVVRSRLEGEMLAALRSERRLPNEKES
jgi:hypothetical protein